MEQLYNVIVTGALAAGQNAQAAKENLMRMFGMPGAQAERLVGGNQYIVKKNVDPAAAEKLRSALEQAGLISRVDPAAQPASPPAAAGLYNLVFAGAIAPGLAVQDVRSALAAQCRMGATVIARLFAGGPVIVSGRLDLPGAERMKSMLAKAGALCEILPVGQDISRVAAAAPVAPPPQTTYETASAPSGAAAQTATGLELTPRFFPLLLELLFCTPMVEIDGEPHAARWWKKDFYPLPPGPHMVKVYFRYFRRQDCGRNERNVTVGTGAPSRVEYFMWPWMLAPGSLKVTSGESSAAARTGSIQPALADLGRRLGAACIDLMIFGFMAGVFAVALTGAGAKSVGSERMAAFVIQLLLWLYFALLESSPLQATVGKKLLRLTVTDEEGERLSFLKATLRHLARLFLLTLTLGLGFFMIALTDRRQGIHDLASRTLVEAA